MSNELIETNTTFNPAVEPISFAASASCLCKAVRCVGRLVGERRGLAAEHVAAVIGVTRRLHDHREVRRLARFRTVVKRARAFFAWSHIASGIVCERVERTDRRNLHV